MAKIEGNQGTLKKVLESYFGVSGGSSGLTSGFGGLSLGGGPSSGIQQVASSSFSQPSSSSIGGMGGLGSQMKIGGGVSSLQPPMMSTSQALNSSISSASFLQSEMNINDPAVLRKRIAELEQENRRLKDNEGSSSSTLGGTKGMSTMRTGPSGGMNQDKDWMNFGSQPLERPTTASSS